MVNTVLCSIFAESFAKVSDAIEAGGKPNEIAAKMLDDHWRVIFNGNGYSEEWPIEAGKRGIWRIDSGVEAMKVLSSPKNIELFSKLKVMTEKEAVARTSVMYDHYSGYVELEAKSMLEMIHKNVIPSAKAAGICTDELKKAASSVAAGLESMHSAADDYSKATIARDLRLETMMNAREVCDKVEASVPSDLWTLATYEELLFLDSNQGAEPEYMD